MLCVIPPARHGQVPLLQTRHAPHTDCRQLQGLSALLPPHPHRAVLGAAGDEPWSNTADADQIEHCKNK